MKLDTAGRLLLLLIAITGLTSGALSLSIDRHTAKIETLWQSFDSQRSEKVRALDVVYAELGYGGMIHSFKNLVLRQNNKDVLRVHTHIGGARSALERYASLGINDTEQHALNALYTTLSAYTDSITKARQYILQGQLAKDIDPLVMVNDIPAFVALAQLDKEAQLEATGCDIKCKPYLRAKLHRTLGYGGMIHHFKNYILRGDDHYRQQTQQKIKEAEKLFDHYQQLPLNQEEQEAIKSLQDMIRQYSEHLSLVETLLRQNKTAETIDSQIAVDDQPAQQALTTLLRVSVANSEDEAHQLYGALSSAHTLANTNFLISIILAILGIIAAWWLIQQKIVQPILRLTDAMKHLADDKLETSIPETTQQNEIGHMAAALQIFKNNAYTHQQAKTELKAILDNAMDGIMVINGQGVVQSVNPAACSVFGYSDEQLLGQNINKIMPEPYASAHDGYLQRYLSGNAAGIIGKITELKGLHKNGTTFPLELGISELSRKDEYLFIGVVRDITERKRLERMKSEFVSTVSHELRTPLTSIMGSIGLIRGGAAGELPTQAGHMLAIAHNNADRLVRLINDILDTEKIESGRMEFHMQPLKINLLINQAIEENRGFGERHNVGLSWSGGDSELEVQGDQDRLLQVMTNLISNAVKYSPQEKEVDVAIEQNNGHITILVTDCGLGIPVEFHNRLFQKFSQADSSDTRQKGGTGLGLAISKAIVEHHGGTIGFNTKENEGTTFYFSLPLLSQPKSIKLSDVNNHDRVLICEDDRDVATLLQLILKEAKIDSDITLNAEEAKKMLAANDYVALTLDLMLPGQDGISFLRELRETAETHDLPVVVISAKATEGKHELNGGAVNILDWIDKPIDAERLIGDLKRLKKNGDRPNILHIEDDLDVAAVVAAIVSGVANVDIATSLKEAKEQLNHNDYQLIILDLTLPDGNGEDILPLLQLKGGESIPVVVFSARDVKESAAADVSQALVKSLTSNEELLETIVAQINHKKDRQPK
jgi:PAS domain S-box-containing protein